MARGTWTGMPAQSAPCAFSSDERVNPCVRVRDEGTGTSVRQGCVDLINTGLAQPVHQHSTARQEQRQLSARQGFLATASALESCSNAAPVRTGACPTCGKCMPYVPVRCTLQCPRATAATAWIWWRFLRRRCVDGRAGGADACSQGQVQEERCGQGGSGAVQGS